MDQQPLAPQSNCEARVIAIWVFGACRNECERLSLRQLIERALADARHMYLTKEDMESNDGINPSDDFGVIEVLTKFLSSLDELIIDTKLHGDNA